MFRWLLTAGSALSAVALGFYLIPNTTALKIVQYGGYHFIFAAAATFALLAIRELRATQPLQWLNRSRWLLVISVLVSLTWQCNEVHGFKVLMDEMVLSVTSMMMHFDRHVFVPMKAHELNGEYVVFGGILDKRPLFFPFLLSVIHDLSGYRVANVFLLNGVVSVSLLVLVGHLGRLLSGSLNGGVLAILLLGGVPLIGLNATGAGFDLLNALMICAVMLAGTRYLRRPASGSQDFLILSTVLLAQTRYESCIYVGATAMLLALAWWRQRRPIFSWGLALAPVLLLTIPLQNRVFAVNDGYWAGDMDDAPFGPKYFFGNLGHAVNFFVSVDNFQSGSPFLAATGIICTPFAFLYLVRRWRQTLVLPEHAAFLAIGLVTLANAALVLFYFWGQLDDFVATRLVIPSLVLFALSSEFVLGRWLKARPLVAKGIATILVAWLWIFAVPFAANAAATRGFLSFQEIRYQMRFIEAQGGQAVFVMPRPLPAVLQRRPTMSVNMLGERADAMDFHLQLGTFDTVFVFQRLELDPNLRTFVPDKDSRLGPEFVLELDHEWQLQPLYKHRISRLVAIEPSKALPRAADWRPEYPAFKLAVPDDEDPTGAFLREYLEKLP